MSPRSLIVIVVVILFVAIVSRCGSGSEFRKSPLDEIVRDLPRDEVFSIILNDMDVEGNFSKRYFHQYEIIKGSTPETITSETTNFLQVSEEEFNRHINDMGMEIAARDSTGKLSKTVAPPGYNNYVGNPKYGRWQSDGSGGSFWAFYGQYAFMSSMFNLLTYPARYSYYNTWRGGYYGTGRPYYGPTAGGTSYYGTNSGYNRSRNPSGAWNNKSSDFKSRVRSRATRSSGRSSGRSSSYRSRGGGSGK
jgi:hypothetical protein